MKKTVMVLALLVLAVSVYAGGQQGKNMTGQEWEQWAGLGDYRPATDDWEAIEEAALKEEGPLVVYSLSSRVFEFGRTFYKKY